MLLGKCIKAEVRVEGLTVAFDILLQISGVALGRIPVFDHTAQIINQLFCVTGLILDCSVWADPVVVVIQFFELGVFLVNTSQDHGDSTDTVTHILLARTEVGQLLRFGNPINGQILFHYGQIKQLDDLEQLFSRFTSLNNQGDRS